MKVGIFETDHFEGAYPVIRLFDIPGNQLVIFTTPSTYKRFADLFKDALSRYQWIVINDKGARLGFFRQLHREAQNSKLDLFYINTISNNHLLFAWVIARLNVPRVVLTLHDINCMFESRFSVQPRKLAHHIGKKLLIRHINEFNVVSDTMLDYLKKKTGGQKQLHNIPGAVFQHNHVPATITDHIRLVIPGTIDKKRRNYAMVFELVKLAEEKQIPLQIVILGGYSDEYGKNIVRRAATHNTSYVKLEYYDTDVVHQDEFDRQLNNAHFVFVPSVIHTAICFDIPEVYGITKSSGNIFDVIKHAKPFIVPQQLITPAALESSCYRYHSVSSLLEFTASLLQNKSSYTKWEQNAVDNSAAYTIEALRAKNISLIQGA